MRFKSYLQDLQNINEEKAKALEIIVNGGFPISPKLWNSIEANKNHIRAYHATGLENIKQISKRAASKKGLSCFTKTTELEDLVGGILTDGGVIVKLEGKRLIAANLDFHSLRDESGRKWVLANELTSFDNDDKIRDILMPTYRQIMRDSLEILKEYFISEDLDIEELAQDMGFNSYSEINSSILLIKNPKDILHSSISYFMKMLTGNAGEYGKVKAKVIANAYDKYEEMIKDNEKLFFGTFAGTGFLDADVGGYSYSWNEVVLNQSKVIEVFYFEKFDYNYPNSKNNENIKNVLKEMLSGVKVTRKSNIDDLYPELKKNWGYNKKQLKIK